MGQIAREIWARWPEVRGVALVQRLGPVWRGWSTTTFVACAGAHRDVGVFEAARYGIDRLKEIVPVWKKEVGADRSVWVEGHYRPTTEVDYDPQISQITQILRDPLLNNLRNLPAVLSDNLRINLLFLE